MSIWYCSHTHKCWPSLALEDVIAPAADDGSARVVRVFDGVLSL